MNAYAQTLAPATTSGGFDLWTLGAILLVVAAIAAFVWYRRKNPAGAAALASTGLADLKATGEKIVSAIENHTKAVAPTATVYPVTPAVPASPAAPPGKNGVAGVLTLNVTGDPKADLEAFTAAYYSS
jgi:hypothetical protein